MSFANPWGLLTLLAVPAIVAIHLYQRRFPPLVVAGLHLWTSETRQPMAGRRRERLPVSLSLLLEVLAAVLLSLVLAQPRLGHWDRVVHLVVVLDNTASMSARPPGGLSFRDQAVAELDRRFATFPRGSLATLLVTGFRPEALGHALPRETARQRLADWKPTAARHSFEPAWDTALQVAEKSGRILFLTNRPLPVEHAPAALEVVSFGQPLENVALSAARWTYDTRSREGRLFLRVHNSGRGKTTVQVRGLHQGKPLFTRELALAAQSGTNLEAPLPGGLGTLNVTVASPDDGLALDSQVQLVEPHPRIVTVANVLPEGHAARESVQRVLSALPELQSGSGNEANLVIAPAAPLPAADTAAWWLGIGPVNVSGGQAADLQGPFVLEKRHPLLEGVELADAIWGGARTSVSGTPLISSGNRRLLVEVPARSNAWLMNVDFSRSNLAESPDWPVLLSNLVEQRRAALPGLQRWNYRLGEDVRFRLFEGAAEADRPLALELEGGKRSLPRTRNVEITAPTRPGLYTVRDGDQVFDRFAINFFDADVSDLRGLKSFNKPIQSAVDSEIAFESRVTWAVLCCLLLVLAIALVDWTVLRRQSS